MGNELAALSDAMAQAVERAAGAVVAVHARRQFPSSGVHVRPGVVVTAEHTVRREEEIRVTLPGGRSIPATLAGRDPGTDLAVLKIEAPPLQPAEPAAGAALKPGHLILAVGRAAEAHISASMGIISGVQGPWVSWRGGRIDQLIRLDLALHPGSSGRAVVDPEGRLLGMLTAGLTRLAAILVPAATIARVVDDLLAKGHVPRGYLGVGLHPVILPDHLITEAGVSEPEGLIVLSLGAQGPAARAGVLIGDVLLSVGGVRLRDTDDVQTALDSGTVGKSLPVRLLRGGTPLELAITVGERPWRR